MKHKKKSKQCGIYCWQNKINNKKYIGQSIDLNNRKRSFGGRDVYSGKRLQAEIEKYGKENFQYSILTHCKPEELDYYEKFYISRLRTTDKEYGYNCTSGGNSQYIRSEECKENMRKAWTDERRKKCSEERTGEKNGNYGKRWNNEQKKHASVIRRETVRKKFFEINGFDIEDLGYKIKEFILSDENITKTDVIKHFRISSSSATLIYQKMGLEDEMSDRTKRIIAKQKKAIVQCDINNHDVILNIFPSLSEAIRMTGMYSIKHCVHGKQSHGCGYYWRYANDNEKPFSRFNEEYLKPTAFYHKVSVETREKLKKEGGYKKPTLRKRVYCYCCDGTLYKVYNSVLDTEKDGFDRSAVSDCCSNRLKTARTHKNFVFSYEELTNDEVLQKCTNHAKKQVECFTKDGKFIKNYESISLAAIDTGFAIANISKCCYGKAKSCGGYVWKFVI